MEVLVIGAGLAGLRAAGLAAALGHEVTVLEASARVGGRIDTEVVDGFRCDRGFQLLNPSYPEAKRALDLETLDLHAAGRGIAVRDAHGITVLADPLRHPSYCRGLLSGIISCADPVALLRWMRLAGNGSLTLHQSIQDAAFSDQLRKSIEGFFAGVVGEKELRVAAPLARTLAAYFLKATPSLPAQGMAAVAHQLAAPIIDHIRFSTAAHSLASSGDRVTVTCASGEELTADRVVVAAGPRASARLAGQPEPAMNSLTTWWFAAARPPDAVPFLHVDVREGARLVHASVISDVCRGYAPAGQHLIQATAVGEHGIDDEAAMALAAGILGVEEPAWRLLVRHEIPDGLPVILPGHQPLASTMPGVILAGDFAEASIQGALASGSAAAAALGNEHSVGNDGGETRDTFTVNIRLAGNAGDVWEKLTDLDAHTAAIPLTVVRPAGSRMRVGLGFVGLTRLGPLKLADRMLVRRADPPREGCPGHMAISKFGPVAGEVEVTVEQDASAVVVTWHQSFRPAWLPRFLRPLGAMAAKAGYGVGLRKLLG